MTPPGNGDQRGDERSTAEAPRIDRCRQLAHDLKNSLAVIGSGLEVLKLTTPPENAREFQDIFEMMDKERKAATKLVDDIRDAALEVEGNR